MAQALAWSPEAVEDIEQIAAFIERDSPHHARAFAAKIIENAELSASHPLMGRVVPELGSQNIRERFAFNYRVIYQIHPERIRVIAIIHGSRLLSPFIPRVVAQSDGIG